MIFIYSTVHKYIDEFGKLLVIDMSMMLSQPCYNFVHCKQPCHNLALLYGHFFEFKDLNYSFSVLNVDL